MRKAAIILPLVLSACATAPGPSGTCQADGGEQFIGQPASAETGTAIMRATRSSLLRWAPPGAMLTMDFNASRVTVRLDADQKVTAVNCG